MLIVNNHGASDAVRAFDPVIPDLPHLNYVVEWVEPTSFTGGRAILLRESLCQNGNCLGRKLFRTLQSNYCDRGFLFSN